MTFTALVVAIVTGLLANELHAHGTWLARRVILLACLLVPEHRRATLAEEWERHIDDIGQEGRHGAALIWSFGMLISGVRLSEPLTRFRRRRESREDRDREIELVVHHIGSDFPAVDSFSEYRGLGPDDVVIEGPCRLFREASQSWGNGSEWISPVLQSPTVSEVIDQATASIAATEDTHHVFLEQIDLVGHDADNHPVYHLWFGS